MAILSKGNTFATGEQVTAATLNNLVDNATFASGAVDGVSTTLSDGKIIVRDGGITSAKLNLSATGSSQNIITFNAIQDGSERKFHIRTPASTSDLDSPFEFFTANAFKFLIDSNQIVMDETGQLGVGVASPSAKLEVIGNLRAGNGTQFVQLTSTGSIELNHSGDAFIDFKNSSSEDFDSRIHANSNGLRFDTGGDDSTATRMTIASDGNVGIGTTSPDTALHIENTSEDQITLTNTSGNLSRIQSSRGLVLASDFEGNSGATQSFVSFEVDNSEKIRINSSSQTIIGQTTTPTSIANSLFVNGRIGSLFTATNANAATSDPVNVNISNDGLFRKNTSSARYKKNIEDYSKGIDALKLLRPVSFQSNNEEDGDKIYAGLIAEEVHDAGLTEFVSYNNDDEPEAIAYSNMVSLLTKALQESITKIEALEARVTALES